jgi:predicted nucleic acid-binding protein
MSVDSRASRSSCSSRAPSRYAPMSFPTSSTTTRTGRCSSPPRTARRDVTDLSPSPGAVLLDTDAFSYLHRGGPEAGAFRPLVDGRLPLLSLVTVGELLRGALQRGRGENKRTQLQARIDAVIVALARWAIWRWRRPRRLVARADRAPGRVVLQAERPVSSASALPPIGPCERPYTAESVSYRSAVKTARSLPIFTSRGRSSTGVGERVLVAWRVTAAPSRRRAT